MKATLKTYRQSPRKVRLVGDVIRGKSVSDALTALRFMTKRAAMPFEKLLRSALANAQHNEKKNSDELFIKSVGVDKGPTLKRFMPRARGRASRINKRTSHIVVELAEF
jgi:large subunit ribosomal protein L22